MVIVAFIHPDLGIGGAERLVCDAALALQKKGHRVKIFTAHHDKAHCFKETADGTLSVVAIGDWLPRRTLGRFYAFWAYVRMIYVAIYLTFVSQYNADVIICDQISACLPVLRYSTAKLLFYCHFPDMLLTQRKTFLKWIYRLPLDWFEEYTTGLADVVMVNSKFTAGIFRDTFTSLQHIQPVVLYPSLNFSAFEKPVTEAKRLEFMRNCLPSNVEHVFLSINRYERKKNLALAINAMKTLKDSCSSEEWKKVHLIMAGGYDERVEENKEHYLELERLSTSLVVKPNITFLRSFSDEEKLILLASATCLLYTPSNEHFGIVPIEAMFMKCPVIACRSGGPLETVQHEYTGFLCEPTDDDFGIHMKRFLDDESLTKTYGTNGRKRVELHFSFDAFTNNMDETVMQILKTPSSDRRSSIVKLLIFIGLFWLFFYMLFLWK